MFDAYGNHIEEGVEVFIYADGFSFQDHLGYARKVKFWSSFCLSHLSVSYDKEIVYKKKFQVAKRELRAVSGVRCIWPFCFSAFHTRYHDLCTDIEVIVLEASNLELLAPTESYGTFQSQVFDHMDSSKCLSDQKDLLVKYISHHTQVITSSPNCSL
ncbi:hypothetical protein B296_00026954 [Ensete ventricosum]|uniref:Uncharacterized protein n=1 Tax=Ensete ventricosum TaxID=4639 RepID=A0A426YS69_ENSVE|nr:hypothetical protein B296_00026954 [Ensete ventricosum]